MNNIKKIDLHMHSVVSDGTDTPEEMITKVRDAGIDMFALTDHDAIKGCKTILGCLSGGDPLFITGSEFSCKDDHGKYHILGYNYDPDGKSIGDVVNLGHGYRMEKVTARLDFIKDTFGFDFSPEDIDALLALNNPGKPHIANLMVRYGYAESKEDAFDKYLNKLRFKDQYVRPEEAIRGILDGFTPKLCQMMLRLAEKYDLYVTAGSDYHGKNKLIALGDNNLPEKSEWPEGLTRFIDDVIS